MGCGSSSFTSTTLAITAEGAEGATEEDFLEVVFFAFLVMDWLEEEGLVIVKRFLGKKNFRKNISEAHGHVASSKQSIGVKHTEHSYLPIKTGVNCQLRTLTLRLALLIPSVTTTIIVSKSAFIIS